MDILRFLLVPGSGDTEMWTSLVLRVGLGLGMAIHGYPKLFKTFGQFSGYVTSLKWPAPKLFAALAVVTEFFGGLFLVIGFLVKPISAVTVVYFLLVILTAHKGQKFASGWELPFMYLLAALALWTLGDSGFLALDNAVFGR